LNADLELRLRRAWTRRGPLALALWPLSLWYGALVALRRRLYQWGWLRATRLPVPVLVVGNVVVGGAGKTPATIAVVRHLKERGWHPGVVSRGHGRDDAQPCLPVRDDTPAASSGDEPLLIRRATGVPVWVGRRRAQAAQALLAQHPEVNLIVCDDGLQHLALARDLELVVFDDRGTGNGWLLPAGLLREPWPRHGGVAQLVLNQHWRADVATQPAGHMARRALADHALDARGERVPLAGLGGQTGQAVHALAGIARPEVFFDMLRARGLVLASTTALPDHVDPRAQWPALAARLAQEPGVLLCTEKDAVKLFALPPSHGLRVLAVPLELAPEPAFWAALDAQLSSAHGRQTP
jgi:tetraacyldisaccharide 4'-kinase